MATPTHLQCISDTDIPQPYIWPASQETLQDRADELAPEGESQEAIIRVLAREYPDQPSENHYANPAAKAVMARIRSRQQNAQRAAANAAWRRERGIPEARTGPADPDPLDEPTAAELAQIRGAADLVRLCARHGIKIGAGPEGRTLVFSRPIDTDGPLHHLLQRHKPGIVRMLQAEGR